MLEDVQKPYGERHSARPVYVVWDARAGGVKSTDSPSPGGASEYGRFPKATTVTSYGSPVDDLPH